MIHFACLAATIESLSDSTFSWCYEPNITGGVLIFSTLAVIVKLKS